MVSGWNQIGFGVGILALWGCSDGEEGHGNVAGEPTVSSANFPQSVASGDPRPHSVVLWTRVVDSGRGDADLPVTLTLATDEDLTHDVLQASLMARSEHDHCIKTRLSELLPDTTYYFRFEYDAGGQQLVSRTGRTHTAPEADSDRPIRFALLNCQDYVGRYYNSLAHLLETATGSQDLDFVVHVGDYVYETTGDPSFQQVAPERGVTFEDEAGAIQLGSAEAPYFAASSLSNYRALYQTYRSDRMLQRVHERFPMVAIWDDHEYANDSWQSTATYTEGRTDEDDPERKRRAERAFFEYMPVEVGLSASGDELELDESALFPHTQLYRSFRYGANAELFLTDYRTYRSDHLIPEDAFPGTIILTETEATEWLGEGLEPYVAIDEHSAVREEALPLVRSAYQAAGVDAAAAADRADAALSGNVSVRYLNDLFEADGRTAPFADTTALPLGLAYLNLGKQELFDDFGARYLVRQDRFAAWARALAEQRGEPSTVLGSAQREWLLDGVAGSSASWKVVASSVSFAPLAIDFASPLLASALPADLPEAWRGMVQLSAEQWDGFPERKHEILAELSQTADTLILSGDIHASFVVDHGDRSAAGSAAHSVFELTGPAVSSATISGVLSGQAEELGVPGAADVVGLMGPLVQAAAIGNPVSEPSSLEFADLDRNGYMLVELDADGLEASYWLAPSTAATTDHTADTEALLDLFSEERFGRVRDGG